MMHRYQIGDEPKKGFVVTEVIPGGMGVIYVVEITYGAGSLKQAIKSCDIERGLAPEFRAKFEQESLLWMSLPPHPRIVKAFSFEFDGGLPNLSMEYVPGGNLRDRISAGPLTLAESLRIAAEFCDGMRFLGKEKGILHLDIKPENVLFDEGGHVKITDFGLARAFQTVGKKGFMSRLLPSKMRVSESVHVIAGTLPYMAPEQILGNAVDSRTDVYAFGVMLYEMLAGRRPFEASDAAGYERAIAMGDIAPLPETVPESLRRLVLRCLKSQPRKRFADFPALLSAVLALCVEHDVAVEPAKTGEGDSALDAGEWNARGYALVQANKFDEALLCYRRGLSVLAAAPRSENFTMVFGVDKKVNASDSLYATLNANMGALLMRMNRREEARAAFESALVAVPDDGLAHLRLGQMALQEGRVAEGLALLKKSVECEPGNSDLLLKYLRACLAYGASAEAERSFDEFLAAKSSDGPFLVGVGCLLDDEFGLEPALRCFDAALKFDEDLASAWYNKGVALQRAGKDKLAIESYKNTVRLDRHHPLARCYLGVLLIRRGQKQEGLSNLKKFLEDGTPSPLTQMIVLILQGAEFGLPLEQLVAPLNVPAAIKHAV